ncbi:MAG: PD40 domain-containing protein [Armatimonadetes bacterium]|nr:PD40 domain-containing protein [Armatimonadota bacterium]
MQRTLPRKAGILLFLLGSAVGWPAAAVPMQPPRHPLALTDALRRALPAFTAAEVHLADGEWTDPVCSLDGRRLVVAYRDPDGPPASWQLLLLQASGQQIRVLAGRTFAVTDLAWGRSPTEVVVAEGNAIWSVPTHGGTPKWTSLGDVPLWSPDGSLYVLPVEDGFRRFTATRRAVGTILHGARMPSWSPSGQWLAYPQARMKPAGLPDEQFSPTCEIRLLEARGRTPRIAWSWPAWKREQQRRRWARASGPHQVFWTADGQSLVGLIEVRERGHRLHYLRRWDLGANAIHLAPVDGGAALLSASRDWRTWLVRLEGRLWLLRFLPPRGRARR